MNHVPIDPAKQKRQKRLEETLRENLKRRKEQARGRTDTAPSSDEGEGEGEDGDDASGSDD